VVVVVKIEGLRNGGRCVDWNRNEVTVILRWMGNNTKYTVMN
jgi:hypothetical protein